VVLNSSGKKRKENNKKKKKIPKIVATFVYASSQGQRTHCARTNLQCKLGSVVCIRMKCRLLNNTAYYLSCNSFHPGPYTLLNIQKHNVVRLKKFNTCQNLGLNMKQTAVMRVCLIIFSKINAYWNIWYPVFFGKHVRQQLYYGIFEQWTWAKVIRLKSVSQW
jgi:hypothetical protein